MGMSLRDICLKLREMKIVVKDSSGKDILTPKWYQALEEPIPGSNGVQSLSLNYRGLWPPGVKTGNKLVKSGITSILDKMYKFKKKFPEYSDDTIIKAARFYIAECKKNNFAYMQTAEYFIYKDKSSALEAYCAQVEEHVIEQQLKSNIRTA